MNSKAIGQTASRAPSRFYFIVWLALGAAGIFYITIASMAPEVLRSADASTLIDSTNTQVTALSSSVAQISTRLDASENKQQAMAGGLEALRADIGGVKSRFDGFGQTVSSRLAALENPGQAGAKASVPATPDAAAAPMQVSSHPPKPPAQVEGIVMTDDGTVQADPTAASPAPKPAKTASAAADTKPPKPYAVDLAMSTSTDALRQIWQLFKDQHGELLTGLTPRTSKSGGNVRLLAGPFASKEAAVAQCGKLRREGIACTATPMAGTPL